MPRTKSSLSPELRVLIASILSFGVILGWVWIQKRSGTTSSPSRPAETHSYLWSDRSGNAYLTRESTVELKDEPTLPGNSAGILIVPVAARQPVALKQGFSSQTFQLYHQTTERFGTPNESSSVVDFVVGETHLGVSQIDVARTLAELFRDFEIDAVFVEQPDDLQYDWKSFTALQDNPDAAITALQYYMVKEAEADPAKFDPYLKDVHTDDDLEEVLRRMEQQFGPSIRAEFKEAERVSELYSNSKYLSATDYFYVTLHLRGFVVPFFNIESRSLRDQFNARAANVTSVEELRPEINARDNYMLARARELLRSNGYRQVVWIVGAQHLEHIRSLLASEGHEVRVEYDSLKAHPVPTIKNEMMALKHPEEVIKLANSPVPASFRADDAFMVGGAPSQQFNRALDNALRSRTLDLVGAAEPGALVRSVAREEEERGLKSKEEWTIKLELGEAGTIDVTRVARNSYDIHRQWPVRVSDTQSLKTLAPQLPAIDPNHEDRLRRINATQQQVRVVRIEDQGDAFVLYDDRGVELQYKQGGNDLDIPAIIRYANEHLHSEAISTIYLELDGFSPDKVLPFETTSRIQQRSLNAQRDLMVMDPILGTSELNDAFFAPAQLDPTSHSPISVVRSGALQGFYRATVQFLVRVAGKLVRLTMEVYAPARDHVQDFLDQIRRQLGKPAQTLADVVGRAKGEIKKKYNLSDNDLKIIIRKQLGGSSVVDLLGAPGLGGISDERNGEPNHQAEQLYLGARNSDLRAGVSPPSRARFPVFLQLVPGGMATLSNRGNATFSSLGEIRIGAWRRGSAQHYPRPTTCPIVGSQKTTDDLHFSLGRRQTTSRDGGWDDCNRLIC